MKTQQVAHIFFFKVSFFVFDPAIETLNKYRINYVNLILVQYNVKRSKLPQEQKCVKQVLAEKLSQAKDRSVQFRPAVSMTPKASY